MRLTKDVHPAPTRRDIDDPPHPVQKIGCCMHHIRLVDHTTNPLAITNEPSVAIKVVDGFTNDPNDRPPNHRFSADSNTKAGCGTAVNVTSNTNSGRMYLHLGVWL